MCVMCVRERGYRRDLERRIVRTRGEREKKGGKDRESLNYYVRDVEKGGGRKYMLKRY
jgi:hypothetical protein